MRLIFGSWLWPLLPGRLRCGSACGMPSATLNAPLSACDSSRWHYGHKSSSACRQFTRYAVFKPNWAPTLTLLVSPLGAPGNGLHASSHSSSVSGRFGSFGKCVCNRAGRTVCASDRVHCDDVQPTWCGLPGLASKTQLLHLCGCSLSSLCCLW
jgi:hypothetical protein